MLDHSTSAGRRNPASAAAGRRSERRRQLARWLHRLFRYRRYRSRRAPQRRDGVRSAAVAAKLVHPSTVVSNGDGASRTAVTAVRPSIVFVILDNGMYGTIRMHQERHYPGRVYGTDLSNPDFAALARAYGATGETVVRTGEFAAALDRALASGRPALLHLRVDPQAVTMNATIDEIRAAALAAT
jgi:acetolactate synthase-1/2/3 large subunit